jgi:lantibiotic modifying enzyme
MILTETSSREKAAQIITDLLPLVDEVNPPNDTLFGGNLARCMLHACLYEARGQEVYLQRSLDLLSGVFDNFNNGVPRLFGPYYSNGLSGFAYALTSMLKKGFLDEEVGIEINDLLVKISPAIQTGLQKNYNDFLHGTFGYLHTLNHFSTWQNDTQLLNSILRFIEGETVIPQAKWIPSFVSEAAETNKIDFGMAHGQSSLLVVLMDAYSTAGRNNQQDDNIRKKIDFIAAAKSAELSIDKKSFFPSWIDAATGEKKTSPRLAWCYSDLGPALLLYKAAEYFDDAHYRSIADDTGLATIEKKQVEITGLSTSQICHGTAGVAQFYLKLYELSGRQEYIVAYEFWIAETFRCLENELAEGINDDKKRGLLDGLIGTLLVLLNYSSGRSYNWERMILL